MHYPTVLLPGCGGINKGDLKLTDKDKRGAAALYGRPYFRLPVPAGYRWKIDAQVNDKAAPDDNNYYSLDIGRWVTDGVTASVAGSLDGGTIDVLAAAAGKVINVVDDCTPGIYDCDKLDKIQDPKACQVDIDHGNGYVTTYLHFAADTFKVEVGDDVSQGQVLGKMGNTGRSCGAHLRFQVSTYTDSAVGDGGIVRTYDGKKTNKRLQGVTLEGVQWVKYEAGKYYRSTNGFEYDPKDNPYACGDKPAGSLQTNWYYGCNDVRDTFTRGETIYGLFRIDNVWVDHRFVMQVWRGGQQIKALDQATAMSKVATWWDYAFTWPSVDTKNLEAGTYELRFFVDTGETGPLLPVPVGKTTVEIQEP
jgi:hypothetical protein